MRIDRTWMVPFIASLLLGVPSTGTAAWPDGGSEDDPLVLLQWHLERIGALEPADAALPTVPPLAILDSGVDLAHHDLREALWTGNVQGGASFARPIGAFAGAPLGPHGTTMDENGHGTAVAGIAGAVAHNGLGGRGVAQTPLMIIKTQALGAPMNQLAIADGIRYAVDAGAAVVSISAAAGGTSPELARAVLYAERHDVLIVAAAGNTGGPDVAFPAAFASVLSVAATDRRDAPASFSSFGKVDLAAPGVDIWTTTLGNGYGHTEGTSMATPQVAAAAVLMRAHAPSLPVQAIRALLNETAQDVGPTGTDAGTGHGILDVAAATAAAIAAEAGA